MYIIEYVWLGGNNELRSKIRVLHNVNDKSCLNSNEEQHLLLTDIPEWNYDGSSTDQASGNDSEIVIKPRALFKNPFFQDENAL